MKSTKATFFIGILLVLVGLAAGYRMCVWFVFDHDGRSKKEQSVFDHDGRSDEEQFVNAIQVGDRESAERMLVRDPKLLGMKDRWERSPLFIAVSATQTRERWRRGSSSAGPMSTRRR